MQRLNEKIADTIFIPKYLIDWNWPLKKKDKAYDLIFEILHLYSLGVTQEFITGRRVEFICLKIDRLAKELADVSEAEIYLQDWFFIGQTIEKWLVFAIEEEEFEVATNLRKLMHSEYA